MCLRVNICALLEHGEEQTSVLRGPGEGPYRFYSMSTACVHSPSDAKTVVLSSDACSDPCPKACYTLINIACPLEDDMKKRFSHSPLDVIIFFITCMCYFILTLD